MLLANDRFFLKPAKYFDRQYAWINGLIEYEINIKYHFKITWWFAYGLLMVVIITKYHLFLDVAKTISALPKQSMDFIRQVIIQSTYFSKNNFMVKSCFVENGEECSWISILTWDHYSIHVVVLQAFGLLLKDIW